MSVVKPPYRQGYGTYGAKTIIKANHFLVSIGNKDLYQYDVTIAPELTSNTMRRSILEFLFDTHQHSHLGGLLLVYDGKKSVFAAGPLPFDSKQFLVTLNEKNGLETEFYVTLKFAARKELGHLRQFLAGRQQDYPQETIQALDVVLREPPRHEYLTVGRSFFNPKLAQGFLGGGIECYQGFYQNLQPTQMGLSLNIDMLARAFYQPILVSEFVHDFLGRRRGISEPLTEQERIKVKRALKGVRVEVHRENYKRRYKVQGLTAQPISQLNFKDDTGAFKSVVRYFLEKYKLQLCHPHLPAIQAGTDAKPIYLPMEICHVTPGQRYSLKLNETQVTGFLIANCKRPITMEKQIVDTMMSNNYNKDPLVSEQFEMNVTEQLTSIEARVLPPPCLRYHKSGLSHEVNTAGSWNMFDLKVINGGTVNFWATVSFSEHTTQGVDHFVKRLVSMCQTKGIVFNPKQLFDTRSYLSCNIDRALAEIKSLASATLAGQQLQLLFIILPETEGFYPRIKRLCETELGIVSQCIKPKHVHTRSDHYLQNVALKINVKVGGRNNVLSACLNRRLPFVSDRPTIIFGAHVTHSQPGEDSSPSIAAVVASIDWPEVTKYKAVVSAQPHRQEFIQDLYTARTDPERGVTHGGLIRELLRSFKKATGYKPHRLIFYRYGVSEDQFSEVLLNEVEKIRKACISLEENYMPPVTFIVVQKRHHTRFFPAKHNDRATTESSGNILAGTVVDTKICHPFGFDFYLCSHVGIQGTSRPTHYHVLYDENKFTADGLQMLTNSLCYTYARCARSVSIVPPAYYARLAAFRARSYMEGDQSKTSSPGQPATKDCVAEVRPLPIIHDSVKSVMFYC